MKFSKILLLTLIVLLYFSVSAKEVFQYQANSSDSTIGNAIKGKYTFEVNSNKGNPDFVGHLFIRDDTYFFKYRGHADLSDTNILRFIFINFEKGNYRIEYYDNINEQTKLSDIKDNQIIGTITFENKQNDNTEQDVISKLLLRTDTQEKILYFHSLQSEIQTWSLEKPIEIQNNVKNSSEVPDTLQLLLKINNILPIGWGTKYSCDILEIKKGYLDTSQYSLIFSLAVGSENIIGDFPTLKYGAERIITFSNSHRITDKPYTPAGITGFVNELGEIWEIVSIESRLDSTNSNNDEDIKLYSDDPTIKRAECFLNQSKIKFHQIEKDPTWKYHYFVKNEYYFLSNNNNTMLSLFFFDDQKLAIGFAEANFPETNELSNWGVNGPMLFHVNGKDESDVSYLLGYFSGEE